MDSVRVVYLLACILLLFQSAVASASSCSRPVRIMPLGNSITAGVSKNGSGVYLTNEYRIGYRQDLYQSLMGGLHDVDFVGGEVGGTQASADGPAFDTDHEGHPGIRDDQVAGSIHSWLTDNPPDYVLLHIGTNNLSENPNDVEKILQEIDRYNTHIEVILARIINQDPFNPTVTSFNDNVAAMASTRIANGDLIDMVDMEPALVYPDDLSDNLHPNVSGYGKMAQVWYPVLDSLISTRCTGAPVFISTPVAWAAVGGNYQYQADVTGEGPVTFSLSEAPAGMTINTDTGLIAWTPTTAGSFSVTVDVTGPAGNTTQTYTLDAINGVVIDNDEAGTTSIGSWNLSNQSNPFGSDSLEGKGSGNSYTFRASASGMAEVSLWWTAHMNRSTNVPVEIYDGDAVTPLDTIIVDQELNGGQWNVLGEYAFSGEARIVLRGLDGSQYTSADALRVIAINPDFPVINSPPIEEGVINELYSYDVDAQGIPEPTYSLLEAPAGMLIDSASGVIEWTPTVAGLYPVTVEAANSAGTTTQSFSIDVIDPGSNLNVELIVNEGDPGTSSVGTWYEAGSGFEGQSLLSNTNGGSYTFQNDGVSGIQEVSLWWLASSNRADNVPVEIYDGDVLLDSLLVNQRVNGGQWNILGEYFFQTNVRIVLRTNGTWRTTSADAVRLRAADISVPRFISDPVTDGAVGVPYSYDVDALASPQATYSLMSPPSGMTIDASTGMIDWIPAATGTVFVKVRAENENGFVLQDFSITVIDTSIPEIISTPVQQAEVGVSYSYDVDAQGDPAPVYLLSTAPAGMMIDAATGLIGWTPTEAGNFSVTVEADNGNGIDSQTFSIEVTDPNAVGTELIIDNGDPGTSSIGTWNESFGNNSYGEVSLLGNTSGGSYTYQTGADGIFEISLWWLSGSNRAYNVPVEIYDGDVLLDTVLIDQRQNGGQWNVLGEYSFATEARIVLRTTPDWRSTSADAVRLVPADTSIPQITSTAVVDGTVGALYSYDVDALANPAASYQLLTEPAGMTIDPATGLIEWTPAAAGTFPVMVEASNANGSDSQSFDIVVSDVIVEPPQITSTAVTEGTVNALYSYDVDALANPAASYLLAVSPAGMTIDPATGLIEWTPTAAGTFAVTVEATNANGSDSQSFDIAVTESSELIVDNGDPSTSQVGSWSEAVGGTSHGGTSLLGNSSGGSYTFATGSIGSFEVSLWWLASSNRAYNVPVEIYDGAVLLDTVLIDQRQNGGQWNVLGEYSFATGARIVLRTTPDWRSTSADAVRLVPANTSIPQITSTAVVDGTVGALYSYDVDAAANPAASYQLLTSPAGMTIDTATGLIEWTPTVAGTFPVTVEATNANGSDSQSFDIAVTDPSANSGLELIVDNGDAGTSSVGTWNEVVGGSGYGGASLLGNTSGGSYTYQTGAAGGTFEISLWWLASSNRAYNVPVEIYDGDVLLDTILIDQRQNGGQWNILGEYSFATEARIVLRTTPDWRSTSADAVRLVPVP